MQRILRNLGVIGLLATGAACSHQMPLVSHAHLGHSLDYWHDTPGNQGLYQVANQEMQTAIEAADQALALDLSARQRRQHLAEALHALDPLRQPTGPGLGYGAIRAWNGAIDHLEYAATSPDASENVVATVATLAAIGDEVSIRLARASETVAGALDDPDNSADQSALTLRRELFDLYRGRDVNGDGAIAMTTDEAGVMQLVAELNHMLGREIDPRYEPLPRRYVLGLVRLPNGTWGFRLRGVGSDGYGY